MDKKYSQEEIDLYLNNKLEGEELKDFEQEMSSDKTLGRKVKITNDLDKAMDDYAFEEDLVAQLKVISANYPKNEMTNAEKEKEANSKGFVAKNKWLISIGIILLTIVAIIYFGKLSAKEAINEQIFAANYEPYQSLQSDRSSTAEEDYIAIIDFYENQQYQEVMPLLEDYIIKNPNQVNSQIMLGNVYLNVLPLQNQKAIDLFQTISNTENKLFSEVAQWYLALAYLKNNEKENAVPILEKLAKKSVGKYSKLAEKLLTQF
jgi:cytochrome c-type biogenesis protein CcmH/NrfG